MRFLLLLVASALALPAIGEEYMPLTGSYAIRGKSFYDPPADEPQDTHIYFELNGKSAQDLYDSMKLKPVRDKCADDGSLTKRNGEMQCTRSADGKDARCWFGVDIKKQKITNGVVC